MIQIQVVQSKSIDMLSPIGAKSGDHFRIQGIAPFATVPVFE